MHKLSDYAGKKVYRCFYVTIAVLLQLEFQIVYCDTYYTFNIFPFSITPFTVRMDSGNAAIIFSQKSIIPFSSTKT